MEEITIIKATVDDAYGLQSLAQQTYSETFGPHNTKENLEAYLTKAFTVEKLVSEMLDKNSQWFIVFSGIAMAGYLKVNFGSAQTELQDDKAMEIERIYVLQKFQGNSIGKLFMDKAIAVARQHSIEYVWLGVWEKNTKALHFYRRQGFEAFSQHSFFVGDDEQTDWMMKLSLTDAAGIVEPGK